MLLEPMRGVKEDKQAGLGHESVELKTHVFREMLKSILSVTRRAGVTPLAAHRSSPCLLRKKYGVGGGTATTRMIHLLCPFWRAFYRNLKNRGRKWSPPPQLHGFVKGRRREGAMATQLILSARLRKLGKSHIRVFFDGTNAFASASREALTEQVDGLLLKEDRGLVGERRTNSMIYMDLQGEDRPLRVVPKCGALMGDSNAPEDFSQAYRPGIELRRERMHEEGLKRDTCSTCPFSEESCDLGCSVFADDIAGTFTVGGFRRRPGAPTFATGAFSEGLGRQGHGQNVGKQVAQPVFIHRKHTHELVGKSADIKGRVEMQAVYLGGVLAPTNQPHAERKRRVQAARQAWGQLGSFWKSAADESVETRVFLAHVVGAMTSGMSAYCLREVDYKIMDSILAGMMKVPMKGRASWNSESGVRTLSHQQLRSYWRIPRVAELLRCLRLGWLQQMVRDHGGNLQVICAFCPGGFMGSRTPLGEDGRLAGRANE